MASRLRTGSATLFTGGSTLLTGGATLVALGVLLVLDFSLETIVPDSALRQLLMLAAVYVMVAVSLNVINGMAGQFSIGHAGFVGDRRLHAAVVASLVHGDSTLASGPGAASFAHSWLLVPISVGAGASMASLFGLLVGLPSLRLRGDYLAIVTLGFAEIFRLVIASAEVGPTRGLAHAIASLGGQNGYAGTGGQGVPLFAGPFWVFGAAVGDDTGDLAHQVLGLGPRATCTP